MNSPLEGYADKIAAAQGSTEWLRSRIGHCTASRFADVLDFNKSGKEGGKRIAYRSELVIERLTDNATERFVTAAMQWGTDHEPMARMAYESATGAMVETCGFVHHQAIKMCGGSPDGYVGDIGMVEFKCPNTKTHIETIMNETCEHLPQIQGLLWITGRQWCDFVSYDPRLPDGLRLSVMRIERDEAYIENLAKEVITFLSQVDAQYNYLMAIAKENTAMASQA